MSRNRLGVLVVAALLVLSVAMVVASRRNQPHQAQSDVFAPGLAANVKSVTEVGLRRAGPKPSVTLHKQAEQWTVAERADYPADVAKLRKLLLSVADAKIIEEKTSLPANFPAIGVDDPAQPSATGTEITIVAPNAKQTLIIGKAAGTGNFARRGGENASYVVEPGISVDVEPRAWIDTRLLDVASATIQSVEYKPTTGSGYVIQKSTAGADGAFALSGAPAGRKPLEAASLAPSATLLTHLAADDVAVAADIDFSHSAQVLVTLADGGVLTLIGAVSGDKRWVQISSTKDSAMNAKFVGRAFDIAAYRYDALFRSVDQLLIPLPAAKAPPAAKPPAAKTTPRSAPAP